MQNLVPFLCIKRCFKNNEQMMNVQGVLPGFVKFNPQCQHLTNICSIIDRPTLTKTSLVNTMDQQYHVDRIKKGDASVISAP